MLFCKKILKNQQQCLHKFILRTNILALLVYYTIMVWFSDQYDVLWFGEKKIMILIKAVLLFNIKKAILISDDVAFQ